MNTSVESKIQFWLFAQRLVEAAEEAHHEHEENPDLQVELLLVYVCVFVGGGGCK